MGQFTGQKLYFDNDPVATFISFKGTAVAHGTTVYGANWTIVSETTDFRSRCNNNGLSGLPGFVSGVCRQLGNDNRC